VPKLIFENDGLLAKIQTGAKHQIDLAKRPVRFLIDSKTEKKSHGEFPKSVTNPR